MTLILTPQLKPYADRWFTAIPHRRSRRRYTAQRLLTTELASRMQHVCEDFRPFPCVRAVFIERAPETLFWGIIGGYGKIKGATSAIIFIGNSTDISYREAVGYSGEGIILEATSPRPFRLAISDIRLMKSSSAFIFNYILREL